MARTQSVLAYREDYLLHGFGVLVVVGHEELGVARVAVLRNARQVVSAALLYEVAVVYGLFILLIGINLAAVNGAVER